MKFSQVINAVLFVVALCMGASLLHTSTTDALSEGTEIGSHLLLMETESTGGGGIRSIALTDGSGSGGNRSVAVTDGVGTGGNRSVALTDGTGTGGNRFTESTGGGGRYVTRRGGVMGNG